MKKFKLAFFALLLMIFTHANPNLATAAELTSSSPAAGSSITSAPSVATITFSNSIGDVGNSVTVTAPNGERVDDGSLQIADTQILVGLKPLNIGGSSGKRCVSYCPGQTRGRTRFSIAP